MVGIELGCVCFRHRATTLALSAARWDHNSAMTTTSLRGSHRIGPWATLWRLAYSALPAMPRQCGTPLRATKDCCLRAALIAGALQWHTSGCQVPMERITPTINLASRAPMLRSRVNGWSVADWA